MNLVLRSVCLVLIAALVAAAAFGWFSPRLDPVPPAAIAAKAPSTTPLPKANPAEGASLLERSPFASNRSAFSRNAPQAPIVPVEVKLAGIFKVGKEMRASINVGGQNLVVKKGDDTPAGKVTAVEASAVVLDGAPPRRIELFKP
jgi:hypothetical protein